MYDGSACKLSFQKLNFKKIFGKENIFHKISLKSQFMILTVHEIIKYSSYKYHTKLKEYFRHFFCWKKETEFIAFIPFLPNANVRFLKMAVMSW